MVIDYELTSENLGQGKRPVNPELFLFKGRCVSVRLVVSLKKGEKVINPQMSLTCTMCGASVGSKTVS